MQEFYKKALFALIFLLLADALLACFFIYRSYLSLPLLSAHGVGARWHYATNWDLSQGGTSTVSIPEPRRDQLQFDFRLTEAAHYPFAAVELLMEDEKGKPAMADFSQYSSISFLARCAPANSMVFTVATFDDVISKPGQFLTYRIPQAFFSCNEKATPVTLDLTRMTIPDWWFWTVKLDLSHQGYTLEKVVKVGIGTSSQAPHNVNSHVEINEMVLHGRDYRYIAALTVILIAGWAAFAIWFFRAHSRALIGSVNNKLTKDLPLVAYRQLTLEPFKDKEKASILRFIATNYTNADLDLEGVVAATGANRNKVNEVLKTELGMTFTSYLNKLRLTEAARLLTEECRAAVAEIAYSVGYSNVSYFNKLFKEEYGCPPKAFRNLADQRETPAAAVPAEPARPTDNTGG